MYEPATCSFLSPDPLIADENNWLNYNRYLYCLGNPVKFADPTGMQVDNYYDVEGVLPRFVPQPIYEPEESFRYIVTDNSWEEQAMATVRFNNAMYELNKVITAGTNNALAFIDHDRNAAVQRALANAAMASAQADAAGKAMEGVNVGNSIFQGAVSFASAFSESFVYGAERLVKEKGYLINELTKNVILKDGGEMPKTDFVYGKGIGNFTRGMEVLGKGALIIQIGVSIFNMADAYSTNNKYKHKILGKSLIDIAVPALCIAIGGPGAWIVGGAYFVVDVAGGWNYVWGIEQ
ncbi:MAG: RHS repeat-associated core domain-containing protein [Paludibacteraceae bacterium]|nr:RHS repeat-associated core domain-containing protein [Paludibacteraceae bacterium]